MGTVLHAYPHEDTFCCVPWCNASRNAASPIPLCTEHIGDTYRFAQSMVSDRWAEVIQSSKPTPRQEARDGSPGYVYFVRIGAYIKIGYSTYPKARFKALKPDEVLAVIPGTMDDEHRHHEQFSRHRDHGEYFRAAPELMTYIADVAQRVA